MEKTTFEEWYVKRKAFRNDMDFFFVEDNIVLTTQLHMELVIGLEGLIEMEDKKLKRLKKWMGLRKKK